MVMVGEVVATALIEQVIEKLSSAIIQKLGMRDNLNRLQSTLSTINAVLEDAEERSVKENDRVLRDWLTKLKDAVYDADDLLDDFRIEAQRKKLDHRRPNILKKVRFFFTSSNPVVFRVKMSHRINGIMGRLDAIAAERTRFHLVERPTDHRHTIIRERETWSKFDETAVICGRDDDVETIMSLLTEENDHGPNINVSIVSIVGMGGLGKTTLAQLVYKMVEEKKLFDLRIWVYVSQDFDPIRIAREAIASATGERCEHEGMESVGKRLVDILKDKRFLLVLDDMWNDNQDEWESKLKPMLNDGKKGSRILVTTRDQNVALMMGGTTGRLHTLGELSDDACWELFKQRAFVRRRGGDKDEEAEEINPQLVKIGKEILKKCGGVPLAAKTLGGIMMFKKTTAEWEAVRDDDIWKLAEVNKGVIASLRLSYTQLSPQVKQCFAYCSMFPKGQRIGKEELIEQWIAQGFIPLSLQSNEIGEEYLGSLLRLSFLQENSYGFWCTMHDLVHDLAASVAGDDVVIIKTEAEMAAGIPKGCRYATLVDVYSPQSEAVAKSFKKVRALRGRKIDLRSLVLSDTGSFGSNLRSLVLSDTGSFDSSFNSLKKFKKLRYLSVSLGGDKKVLLGSLCSLQSLQALHLSDCIKVESIPESIGDLCDLRSLRLHKCRVVKSYPDSIGNLENLRILDLSWNAKLKQLPDSVGRLQNLRTLNLSCCLELQALPESMTDLVHLEKMDLSSCLKLEHLPDSIGRLQNLPRLNLSSCEKLQALPESVADLVNLEEMNMSYCRNLEHLPDSIGRLQNLRTLNLSNCNELRTLPKSVTDLVHLEEMDLSSCLELEQLPDLIGRLRKLRRLNLHRCIKLQVLPESVSDLVHLEKMGMSSCEKLEQLPDSIGRLQNIRTLNLSNCNELRALPDSVTDLVHLVEMNLSFCEKLEHLIDSIGRLQNLRTLNLSNCNKLRALPESVTDLVHLEEMDMSSCVKLEQLPDSIGRLQNIRTLNLSNCNELRALPESVTDLVHLEEMDLSSCEKLEHLPDSIARLQNLRTLNLSNCKELRALPESVTDLVHLDEIDMSSCEKLEQLPYSIGRLQNLRTLNLSNCNELRALPESVTDLVHLEEMNLSFCEKLEHLPDSIGRLQNLWRLILSFCGKLQALPESVADLVHLEEMDLSNCKKLEQLPDLIGRLKNLPRLNLSGCSDLRELPESVTGMVHLEEMNLSYCKKLEQLPDSIGRLRNLPRLNLSYCEKLQALTESVSDLVNLKEMDLSYCKKLEQLPDSIGRLQNLRRLKLSFCNKLKALPESVTDLAHLEEMDLSSCLELQEFPNGFGIKMRNLRVLWNKGCSKMKGMPIDLAQLENLRTLSVFIVGEEEEGFCSIASLEHMNQLEGKLTIKKLERLVRNPFDAKKANLEKKENLRTVAFKWSSRDRAEEGDGTATAAATVFEHLLPPPGINKLTIDGYPGTKYPSWMMQIGSHYSFLKLTKIKFVDHKRCDRLPPLGVLPSLERLKLKGMHGIRTIVDELNGGVIGSASSLKEISFIDMPNFEEWTTARLISNGQPVTIFPNLKTLMIGGCSLLKAQPCLPPSIESLTIKNCSAQFEWQGLLHLTGLTVLHIEECSVLSELPECIGDLQSLHTLVISRCDRLTTMPHFLRRLPDLRYLIIEDCPQLESRCKEETGEDWSNISHIPNIIIR